MPFVLSVAVVLGQRQEDRFQGSSRGRKDPDLVGLGCCVEGWDFNPQVTGGRLRRAQFK